MDIEACLTLLADEHRRFLWREEGEGWSFVSGSNQRNSETFPTIGAAISNEISRLETSIRLAKTRVENERSLAEDMERKQADLLTAFGVQMVDY